MNLFMRFQSSPLSVSWTQGFKSSMLVLERQSDRSNFNHYHGCGLTTEESMRPDAANLRFIYLPNPRQKSYSFAHFLQNSRNKPHWTIPRPR